MTVAETAVPCPHCGSVIMLSKLASGNCPTCSAPLSKSAVTSFPWSHFAGANSDKMLAEKLETSKALYKSAGIDWEPKPPTPTPTT